MPIPENQLEIWAKYHSTNKAQYTHKVIRKAIRTYNYSRNYDFEDYLQGSYASHTNIYADTDVDIVVQLNSVFRWNGAYLSAQQRRVINETYPTATYSLVDFKSEVISALRDKFGYFKVEIGNKSVKVLPDDSANRYKADVVIALQYRLYVPTRRKNTKKDELTRLYYYEGIWFSTEIGEEIINYPKLHLSNGLDKNQKTNGKFKPVVRIFKNMRNKAIELGYLPSKEIAASYFIQCLLYNVPEDIYTSYRSYQDTVENILNYLHKELTDDESYKHFVSQNEIVPLFGSGNDKWNINLARLFLKAMINMWDNWK